LTSFSSDAFETSPSNLLFARAEFTVEFDDVIRYPFFSFARCQCKNSSLVSAYTCSLQQISVTAGSGNIETRYWYNQVTGTCTTFQFNANNGYPYAGNANNFLTQAHCLSYCANRETRLYSRVKQAIEIFFSNLGCPTGDPQYNTNGV